jgi:hypothetical protein
MGGEISFHAFAMLHSFFSPCLARHHFGSGHQCSMLDATSHPRPKALGRRMRAAHTLLQPIATTAFA